MVYVLIIPDHLVGLHPFVALSLLNPNWMDFEDMGVGDTDVHNYESSTESVEAPYVLVSKFDRRCSIFIEYNPNLRPEALISTKTVGVAYSARMGQKLITEISVRDHGTDMFTKNCTSYTLYPHNAKSV